MTAYRHSLLNLPTHIQLDILSYIDDRHDVQSLRLTCRRFASHIPQAYANSLSSQTPSSVPVSLSISFNDPFASTSSTTSSTHSDTSPHSIATSDSGLTSPEEDPNYSFEITADLTRRLSLLPSHPTRAKLPFLPTELQLQIFSHLDKIDSCCFGLSHPITYSIYRSIFGTKMPLNTRRPGPNNLERAWEVVGKQMCKHCGVYRCELWKHLESWMPDNVEYCSMLQNFGPRGEHGKENCYRVKPSKPRRCGKHPIRTTSLHQDDANASTTMAVFASAVNTAK